VLVGDSPYTGAFTVALDPDGLASRRASTASFRDTDGRFALDAVTPGVWVVRVVTARGLRGEAPASLAVYDGATFDVSVRLVEGGRVHGVLRQAGDGVSAGGRIVLTHEETGERHVVATDARGRFSATGLAAGSWRLLARGPGGAPTERRFGLAPGGVAEVDVRLGPVGTVVVYVHSHGRDGSPHAGALVTARPRRGPSPSWPTAPRTDGQGRVVLEDVPEGTVEIVARTADGAVGRTEVEVTSGGSASADVVVGPADR
jgi:hypothetical protein